MAKGCREIATLGLRLHISAAQNGSVGIAITCPGRGIILNVSSSCSRDGPNLVGHIDVLCDG
jgi:hypothetical protein